MFAKGLSGTRERPCSKDYGTTEFFQNCNAVTPLLIFVNRGHLNESCLLTCRNPPSSTCIHQQRHSFCRSSWPCRGPHRRVHPSVCNSNQLLLVLAKLHFRTYLKLIRFT